METFETCLLTYRRRLRELLFRHGVASNPGVTDDWILDKVEELVNATGKTQTSADGPKKD
jgi:hypothetical protein